MNNITITKEQFELATKAYDLGAIYYDALDAFEVLQLCNFDIELMEFLGSDWKFSSDCNDAENIEELKALFIREGII